MTTMIGHSRGINDVCWSNGTTDPYCATASDDKTLRIFDVQTSDSLVEFRGHDNFVFCCQFNPPSNLLASGSFDETVKLWDVRSGLCVCTLLAHSDPVTAVSFNRDGTCVVAARYVRSELVCLSSAIICRTSFLTVHVLINFWKS